MGSPQRTFSMGTRSPTSELEDISPRVGRGPHAEREITGKPLGKTCERRNPYLRDRMSVGCRLTRAYSAHGQAQIVLRTGNLGGGGGDSAGIAVGAEIGMLRGITDLLNRNV